MDPRYELGRVAQEPGHRCGQSTNCRTCVRSKLERVGRMLPEIKAPLQRYHAMVDYPIRERDKLTRMIARLFLR
jgi:hypothetical protein